MFELTLVVETQLFMDDTLSTQRYIVHLKFYKY